MSIAYDVGFTEQPELKTLDDFMGSLGFEIEAPNQRRGQFTQVYVFNDGSVSPREIVFFYRLEPDNDQKSFFRKRSGEVKAYGSLTTYSTELIHPTVEERLRIIEEKGVRTQHDYYRHLQPERLKFYETALALRDHYHAIVRSEQTGEEINPEAPFPPKREPVRHN